MNMLLSPSLLSANFAKLGEELAALKSAGITWLHLDVMDGVFVPNITFGQPLVSSLRKVSDLFFDVHLMIEDPGKYVKSFAQAGADLLVPHLETMRHPQRVLELIHESGMKAGIALCPHTDPSQLRWLLPYLDLILIMGVNPGFSGQKFIPETLEKLRICRSFLQEHGFGDLPLEVDGGVNSGNTAELIEAGADILVSGSAFFKHTDYATANKLFAGIAITAKTGEAHRLALARAAAWRAKNLATLSTN